MRKFNRWVSLIATSAALSGGCTSSTTNNGSTAFSGWHWPWSKPAAITPGAQLASEADCTSLASKPPKLGPDLYVATARVYEKNADYNGAAGQYQKALQTDPNHLPALLGYAQLEDSQRHYNEADHWYQEALKRHPKDAAVYNDRGLSLQRRGKLDDAAKFIARAIELQPDKALYRNNMATVLVAMQRHDEALSQLTAVHGPAGGHYNLAILLHRKGADQEAQFHFMQASQIDPSMVAAREWAERLASNAQLAPVVADNRAPTGRAPVEADRQRPIIVQAPGVGAEGPNFMPPAEAMNSRGPQPELTPPQFESPATPTLALRQPSFASQQPTLAPRLAALPPEPTMAPPQPALAPPTNLPPSQSMVAMNSAPEGMRYPQRAPVSNFGQGEVPPTPDRLNEMPSSPDNVRPLPPLQ